MLHRRAAGGSSPAPNLTRDEARARSQLVRGVVDYELELEVEAESSAYQGRVVLDLDLGREHAALFLDYQGRKVKRLEVNGDKAPVRAHKKDRIHLPAKLLRKGHNRVEVDFESDFDNDGAGLHKSLDPVDRREYFYATLEPFDCNRIFPCFDQPDIKGTYDLTVAAPPHWEVIASGPEVSAIEREGRRVRRFARTEPFSTYIFGLCVGPYASWTDPAARIPSRIFAPQSAAERVDVEEIFEITRQGFDFYEPYFEIPYPFHKYDQVFCPQFNWGAMENVACVAFNDRYLFRHEPTEVERQRRANTILHEMAHMWFGNLVTMDWWNDLWLNESFATYMANLALVEATRFQGAWEAFYQATKSWAYWQDELPTTHPIETPVPDTDTTHTNFDGITYGKGASVLKQLAHFLGGEPFRKGVASYLKAYSWKNASRADFLRHLGKAAGRDMKRWTKLWLQSSGTNGIAARWRAEGGKLQAFELLQEPGNGDAKRRPHALEVALYKRRRGGGLRPVATRAVQLDGARTEVPALIGKAAPDFVFPNHGDHAFARFGLDPASLAFARAHLEELPSTHMRGAVWRALRDMMRTGELDPRALPQLFLDKAAREPDDHVLQRSYGVVQGVVDRCLPDPERPAWVAKLHDLAWTQVRKVAQGSDLQKVWFSAFLGTAEAGEAPERLVRMLRGQEFVRGLELDQDKRWAMVQRLGALGVPEAAELLAQERARDPSEPGQTAAFMAEVARPEAASKLAAWEQFCTDVDSPLDLLRAGMKGFWWPTQRELLRPYARKFFQVLPKIDRGRGYYFTDAFVAHLFPLLIVEEATWKAARKAAGKKLPVALRRPVIEQTYELELALRARAYQA